MLFWSMPEMTLPLLAGHRQGVLKTAGLFRHLGGQLLVGV